VVHSGLVVVVSVSVDARSVVRVSAVIGVVEVVNRVRVDTVVMVCRGGWRRVRSARFWARCENAETVIELLIEDNGDGDDITRRERNMLLLSRLMEITARRVAVVRGRIRYVLYVLPICFGFFCVCFNE